MAPITPIDFAAASDDELADFHAVFAANELVAGIPEPLICSRGQGVLDLRHFPITVERRGFVVTDGGRVVATALCEWEDVESNRDHVSLEIEVHPDARRAGLGSELLRATAEVASVEFDARVLDVAARRDDPAVRGFLGRYGFEDRCVNPRNVLWTRDLDRKLLTSWIDSASERASDYELIRWDGRIPDEHFDEFVNLWPVMNTAPHDNLDWDDEVVTPERAQAWDTHWIKRGITARTVVARHRDTLEFAGFTVLTVHDNWPTVAEQEDTGVRPEHRNCGLGRWLKAVNALRIIEERRGVEAITTWNAGSNAPMLAINHAMGFQPIEWWADWQADVKTALDRLS